MPTFLPRTRRAISLWFLAAILAGAAVDCQPAVAAPTDAEVRQAIILDSIATYKSTGHPCACPYDLARNGSHCGGRSAYSRPGGAAPLCYPKDVTAGMVQDWRAQHQ
jgi:hypothetical protein